MATYYVDSNATYEANIANGDGTSSDTPSGGVGGLQRAVGKVAAGETINIKNGTNIDLSKLVKVVCTGTLVGTIAVGDLVYCFEFAGGVPTVAEAAGGQGYVAYITGKTYYIDTTKAGSWTTGAAHCITKENAAVFANYIEAITVTTIGLVSITSGSQAAGRIQIIGVNASWANDGTQTIWDGNHTAAYGHTFTVNSYYHLKNIMIQHCSTGGGFAGGSYNIYENCRSYSHTAPGNGWADSAGNLYYKCTADSNGGGGIATSYGSAIIACTLIGNSTNGASIDSLGAIIKDCLIHGNTQNGILSSCNPGGIILNNVIDGNGYNGISATGTGGVIIGNRITNNGTSTSYYGINANGATRAYEDYNVFYKNGTDADGTHTHDILTPGTNTIIGGNSLAADNATECGYTDAAGHDFNLTTVAILRNTALELPAIP